MNKLNEKAKKYAKIKNEIEKKGYTICYMKIFDLKGHKTFNPYNNEPIGEIVGDYDNYIIYKK